MHRGRHARTLLSVAEMLGGGGPPWSVVIADDAEIVRAAVVELVDAHADFVVVAQAADGPGAVAAARDAQPHVAVVDVHMPGGGPDAASGIARVSPRTKVVAYSVYGDEATRAAMADAGAVAYAVKGRDVLLDVLREVCDSR
jgi:DNA-binding NarL/FixJ family response regulator